MGRGVNSNHHHHQLSSSADPYRENVPGAEFQLPPSRELKLFADKPIVEKEKKTLRDLVPPLCASRLKPIRQKTKNAVVTYCSCFSLSVILLPSQCEKFLTPIVCFYTSGEHPGHRWCVYGTVEMPRGSREGQRSPSDFLWWINGELWIPNII